MDHNRRLSFLGALLAAAGVLFAMLLERQGYAPCPLCLIQRWALGIVGLCLLLRSFAGARQSLWRQGLSALALFFPWQVLPLDCGSCICNTWRACENTPVFWRRRGDFPSFAFLGGSTDSI